MPRTGPAGRRLQDLTGAGVGVGVDAGAGVCMFRFLVRCRCMIRCCNSFQELRASKAVKEGEELTDCYLDLRSVSEITNADITSI